MGYLPCNLMIQRHFTNSTVPPLIFVLGVFLVSLRTEGYLWGIVASLFSVGAVNYVFTHPYYAFDFLLPESLFSAAVMLLVAILTSALTTKVKRQEKLWAENEREKMRANLLRAVSHDLRTPLTSIYGSTSTIIENYDSLKKEQQIKLLREINEDTEWLIRMVENLLSVTRIDGDRVQVTKTPTVVEELIDDALMKFRSHHPDQAVTVIIPDEFISIPMDALLIVQVILNLLENAVYHAKGMTELSFVVRAEGKWAVFEVMDNGCGISPDRMDGLFTGKLGRSDVPTDGSRSGMGIGLTVCATIIRAHGGAISAENRAEGGALFRFTLEMERSEYEQ